MNDRPDTSSLTSYHTVTRRRALMSSAASAASLLVGKPSLSPAAGETLSKQSQDGGKPWFRTRGVVLLPRDISNWQWPRQARNAGLSTIGVHSSPRQAAAFVDSDAGQEFLDRCRALDLEVEFELHAMSDLLPRKLFDQDPQMFPMDEQGRRIRDYNVCVHSRAAVDVVCENVERFSRILQPRSRRHFYWIDDYKPMCRCRQCRSFSDSDQALILENEMLKRLQKHDPAATLAHLSYHSTLQPPAQVTPLQGMFLEFAPMRRRFDVPLSRRDARLLPKDPLHGEQLDWLDGNLDVFGSAGAQVLEYWIDESLFARRSPGKKPAKIPWSPAVFLDDLNTYGSRGIRHVTSFAVKVDREYVKHFGNPPLAEYAAGLREYEPGV